MRAGTQKNAEEAGDLHLKTRFHGQMSDTFHAAVFVTRSGGFQDAYTYICRGQVFANAQTSSIVLLSAALLRGDWAVCLKYVIHAAVLRVRHDGGGVHPHALPQFPAAALAAAS